MSKAPSELPVPPRGLDTRVGDRDGQLRGGFAVSTPCLEWKGARHKKGYGTLVVGRKRMRAHRVAYTMMVGIIPPGAIVCHACDNPPCVNPDHLWVGTNADNIRDMMAKKRQPVGSQKSLSKLDEIIVMQLRESRALGMTIAALATAAQVSTKTVRDALGRVTWKHVA